MLKTNQIVWRQNACDCLSFTLLSVCISSSYQTPFQISIKIHFKLIYSTCTVCFHLAIVIAEGISWLPVYTILCTTHIHITSYQMRIWYWILSNTKCCLGKSLFAWNSFINEEQWCYYEIGYFDLDEFDVVVLYKFYAKIMCHCYEMVYCGHGIWQPWHMLSWNYDLYKKIYILWLIG